MNGTTAGRRRKITLAMDVTLVVWGIAMAILFLSFFYTMTKLSMDTLTFVTSIMAIAIWVTAMISWFSLLGTRDMLRINWQMLEEMRRSRPKPLVVANVESAPSGHGYRIVAKNKGRESARDIKVRYCRGEVQENKPSGTGPTILKLVDSPWAEIGFMPLGPGETQKFDFPLDPAPPFIAHFKFEVTYSDGVESYKETYQVDVSEIEWG